MNITVIGSGYVGTTTAALLANSGYTVTALDTDTRKVASLNKGRSPFFEAGLDELLTQAVQSKSLVATDDYSMAITGADSIISCVGTPDNADGSSNLSYVFSAAESAARYLKKSAVYVQKSTVPVGTGRRVIKLLPKHVSYVSNPEFLREGTAVSDTLLFDRVVVGGDDSKALEKIVSVYKQLQEHFDEIKRIATSVKMSKNKVAGEYIKTTLESAELIKVTANAFLALKISFANSIAKLCDETNADVNDVMAAVGSDSRIGKAFLNAGRGYGGGCFPKDVSGLISSALEYGVDLQLMTAVTDVNASMPGYVVAKTQKQIGSLKGKKVAVLGLAFKEETSDARKSPAVAIANLLVKSGANVTAYDPEASEEAKEYLSSGIKISPTLEDAVKNVSVLLVATKWPQFIAVKNWLPHANKLQTVVDCMNCLNKNEIISAGYNYIGVGRD